MKLIDYINRFYGGNQSRFAERQGVKLPQITQWIKKGFIVIDDVLYSPRRELNVPNKISDNDNDKKSIESNRNALNDL